MLILGSLATSNVDRRVAVVVTRTRVDPNDQGFAKPTKPVGRYAPEDKALLSMEEEEWADFVELRRLAAAGHFASGSMGPKVEAALRFVEGGGRRAVITTLDLVADAVGGKVGTVVEPD